MVELRLLGGLDIAGPDRDRGRAIMAQPRRAALLVYLAARNYHGLERRDHLIQIFFPDSEANAARQSLRQSLLFIRRALGEKAIVTRNGARGDEEVGIDPIEIRCDVAALERFLGSNEVERADEIYRGELLTAFPPTGLPHFERWLDETRDDFRARMRNGLRSLAERDAAAGNAREAVRWARRELDVEPTNEDAAVHVMQRLIAAGEAPQALALYDALSDRLKRELDDEPGEALAELAEHIRQSTAKTPAAFSPPPALRSLVSAPLSPVDPVSPLVTTVVRSGETGPWLSADGKLPPGARVMPSGQTAPRDTPRVDVGLRHVVLRYMLRGREAMTVSALRLFRRLRGARP